MENGDDAQTAAEKAIKHLHEETGGRGGVICIDKNGKLGHSFSTYRMGWALIDGDGVVKYGIDQGQTLTARV